MIVHVHINILCIRLHIQMWLLQRLKVSAFILFEIVTKFGSLESYLKFNFAWHILGTAQEQRLGILKPPRVCLVC